MILSATVAYAYSYVIEPVSNDGWPNEVWRWLTSGMFGVLIVMLKMGYSSVQKGFKDIMTAIDKQEKKLDELSKVVQQHSEDIIQIKTRCDERHNGGM